MARYLIIAESLATDEKWTCRVDANSEEEAWEKGFSLAMHSGVAQPDSVEVVLLDKIPRMR